MLTPTVFGVRRAIFPLRVAAWLQQPVSAALPALQSSQTGAIRRMSHRLGAGGEGRLDYRFFKEHFAGFLARLGKV